jgi:hypothetical protein
VARDHRNLRTRRRRHYVCMQDDQIGPKIVGLAPADMAKLPPSIIPTQFFVVNNLVCQLGLHLLCTCLSLQGISSDFISTFSFLILDFYARDGFVDAARNRVARFFLMQHTKTGKICQISIQYTK